MTPRFRLALVAGAVALAGCSDTFNAGEIPYSRSPDLATLKQEDGTPKRELQRRVTESLGKVFGADPQHIVVPKDSGLPLGGLFLADHVTTADGKETGPVDLNHLGPDGKVERTYRSPGGYNLYRKHCLHCHGVSGDGEGPTAAFLWPRPRDYRRGVFKFTSTTGVKPTRADLRRIILQGIANSSMPSFEALMTEPEIEEVIDYVIFLSARGETERRLINEASTEDEPKDAQAESAITAETATELANGVFEAWKTAETEVLNPPVPRTPSTPESVANGKKLFLGQGAVKLECAGCHGPRAQGNGPSFVPYAMFRDIVFGGDPALQEERLREYLEHEGERAVDDAEPELAKIEDPAKRAERAKEVREARISTLKTLWTGGSLDEWGNPLRPANINNGSLTMYKGGRRPIDIYWRIAKGINGAKMPAHANQLKPEQIWDLVNFVLALPYQPDLLDDAPDTVAPAATTPAAATASK